MLRRRSWRWLRARILGLLAVPASYVPIADGGVVTVQQTRLMNTLQPPREEHASGPQPQ